MTNNQMPKVGDKFRFIKHKEIEVVVREIKGEEIYLSIYPLPLLEKVYSPVVYEKYWFWEVFKPLPNPELKEKLPEVRKSYKSKSGSLDQVLEVKNGKIYMLNDFYFKSDQGGFSKSYSADDFWKNYEEIPSNNQQEESESDKCPQCNKELDMTRRVVVKHGDKEAYCSFYCANQADKKSEVEKAKEELKHALRWGTIQQRANWVDEKAQNLINALESMGESNIQEKGYPIGYEEDDREKEPSNLPSADWTNEQIRKGMAEQYKKMLQEENGDCGIVEDAKSEMFGTNRKGFIEYDFENINYPKSAKVGDSWYLRASKMQSLEEMDQLVCINDSENGKVQDFAIITARFGKDQVEEEKESEEDCELEQAADEWNTTELKEEKESEEEKREPEQIRDFKKLYPEWHHLIEEKPKSIWKEATEFPEEAGDYILSINCKEVSGKVLAHYYSIGEKKFATLHGRSCTVPLRDIEKYCHLTDFINAFEDIQERVKKLEEK